MQAVFGQILAHRVDYAALYFSNTRSESWSLEEGIVKSGSFNIDQGVGVRAVSGEKTAFAYSDDISLPALEAAARTTRAIAPRGRPAAPGRPSAPPAASSIRRTTRSRACRTRRKLRCSSASSDAHARSTRA